MCFGFQNQVPSTARTLTTVLSPQTHRNISQMRQDMKDKITSKQSLKLFVIHYHFPKCPDRMQDLDIDILRKWNWKSQQGLLVHFNMSQMRIDTSASLWFIVYYAVTQGPFSTPSCIQLACLGLGKQTTAHCSPQHTQQEGERRLGESKHPRQHGLRLESWAQWRVMCLDFWHC